MIFTRKTNATNTLMNIKTDNVPMQKVDQTRFLGVIINDKLLWDDHIKTIRVKISEGLGILARLRHCLPSHILVISTIHLFIHTFIIVISFGQLARLVLPLTIYFFCKIGYVYHH